MATLISPEEAQRISHAVIDVREFAEYASGTIRGSRLVPLATLEREASKWNKSDEVLLVCRSGMRAARAADTLERLGFQKVNVLQGGMDAWTKASFPIHITENGPWSIERQVRAIAGGMVVVFTLLGVFVSPWFLTGTLVVGAGLVFAGVTDTCLMGTALGTLPWNQSSAARCESRP